MNVVPDEILESRICDNCYKFLTVEPVRLYPSGRLKCGRCEEESGNSGERVPGIQGVFKCVNRFDGCRRLLTPTQVKEHEQGCQSKEYACPKCPKKPVTRRIPTYLLIKHFKDAHRDCLLLTSSIRIEMAVPVQRKYLYRVKENLFVVECNNPYKETIEIKTTALSPVAGKATVKYTIYFGDAPSKIETEPRVCLPYGSSGARACTFQAPERPAAAWAVVELEVDLRRAEVELAAKALTKWRDRVQLPRSVRLEGPHCSRLSIGDDGATLVVRDCSWESPPTNEIVPAKKMKFDDSAEYFMSCSTCLAAVRVDAAHFIEIGPRQHQALCYGCRQYYVWVSNEVVPLPVEELCPELKTAPLSYSCVWRKLGCGEYHDLTQLDRHEAVCLWQPAQWCPVVGCDFEGTLPEIKEHFKFHPNEMMLEFREILMFEGVNKDYQRFYMWAYFDFVTIEVSPLPPSHYNIALPSRRTLESFGKPEPSLIVTEFSTGELRVVTYFNAANILNDTKVHVTCFFEKY